jgi:GNAT superfamily N-acetyltransferase
MHARFAVRRATVADIDVIAHHRVAMFTDMGRVRDAETRTALYEATVAHLHEAMPREEYLAWLAVDASASQQIVAGAGVWRRDGFPFPLRNTTQSGIAIGREAIVMNVYTEPAWRRQGVALALMRAILEWAQADAIDSLVLHASTEGRPLYERLGFVATNEMRLVT